MRGAYPVSLVAAKEVGIGPACSMGHQGITQLLGPGDLRRAIRGSLPPGLDGEPEARSAVAVRRIGISNARHSAP